MICEITLSPILLTPFKPNKIWLFSSSGSKLNPDWLMSINETDIPLEVIAPIAFANFV